MTTQTDLEDQEDLDLVASSLREAQIPHLAMEITRIEMTDVEKETSGVTHPKLKHTVKTADKD